MIEVRHHKPLLADSFPDTKVEVGTTSSDLTDRTNLPLMSELTIGVKVLQVECHVAV